MPTSATVSALLVRKIIAVAAFRGADPVALTRAIGLEPAALTDPIERVPYTALLSLWDLAPEATGDPDFGLHLAEMMRQTANSPLAFAVISSATLGAALNCLMRYWRLVHESTSVALVTDGDVARLRFAALHDRGARRHGVECALAQVLIVARAGVGASFTVREVSFAHPRPASTSEHARVFGVAPRFEAAHNELVFERALLDQPFEMHDPSVHSYLGQHLEQLLARLDEGQELRARVQRAVAEQLSQGAPDVDVIARKLSMSARTLQRRLQEEGTSFQEVANEARREMALRYLGDDSLTLTEITFLLGFTEPSNFHRAFKRWTGTTPAEARRRAVPSAAGAAHS